MAKNKNTATTAGAPKKRRWYQNLADAYRVTARTYKWIGAALIGLPILIIGLAILYAAIKNSWIWPPITGVMLSVLADMMLLSMLLRPAMYSQLDGTAGAVYSVISQIKRGWVVAEEPIQVNRDQDLIWRLVGRPGVVLISEGPTSRVMPLLNTERKKVNRIATNVPVTFIQVGSGEGQISLGKLNRKLRSLPAKLTRHEVPAVAARLEAVGRKGLPIPKGVDPTKTRMNRRALRGN